MIINHNMNALNAHRMMSGNTATAGKSMEKLSSGLRINRAGDDAAGLAISEKMRGQIRGLDQASRNGQDAISMIQTAEGALNETHSILQRMRELAVQSSNDTNITSDRTEIQGEMDELAKEITRISNNTEFNTQKLINGGITDTKFHVGANKGQDITLAINAMDAASLGVVGDSITPTVTTGTGDVTAATVTGSAAAVADGNTITVTSTLVSGGADTSATLTDGNHAVATDLSAKTASITINVDGTDYTINDLSTWDGSGGEADLITLLGNADTVGDGSGTKLSTVASITGDGSSLSIETTSTNGTSSTISVTYGGADAADAATLVGIADSSSAAGTDAGTDTYTITFADTAGSTNSVVTGVATDATSVSGTGDFAGFSLTLDGTLADGVSSTIALAVTTGGAAATFNADGTLANEATTNAGIDVSTQSAASNAIETIQTAIETVSSERSKLGAYQNRLEHTIANLGTASENLTSAESRIRDVDMAKEMMNFSKNNILSQAAQAMLAQANQQPQGVLQLLR